MATFTIQGRYLARRGFYQTFRSSCEAPDAAHAREWALSEIGGCHHVPRRSIVIESVAEATP
ncbi:MAG TPA: 50S ribosomal protein L18Ae [Thermoplasmata archaeon]|nr:50S ribosomal protein L18Ae [Thermoplasmata archaeon]